jgi:hypothetical protein
MIRRMLFSVASLVDAFYLDAAFPRAGIGTELLAHREEIEVARTSSPFERSPVPMARAHCPYRRAARAPSRRMPQTSDSLAERGGFELPVPRGGSMNGIRREFGALFGPTKSIRAGENLFAWHSTVLQLSPVGFVRQVEGDARRRAPGDKPRS